MIVFAPFDRSAGDALHSLRRVFHVLFKDQRLASYGDFAAM